MVTQFEASINCIVDVFHSISLEGGGHAHALSREKLEKLIKKEVPELLTNPKNPKTAEDFLKEVDSNKDGMMNFEEFLFWITRLAVDAHDASHE